MSDFSTEITVKAARKSHQCNSCYKQINIGESYLRVSGCWDGEMATMAYHADCQAWEIHLNNINGIYWPDDWMTLAGHVSDGGFGVLDGAPLPVQARFDRAVKDQFNLALEASP